MSIAAPWSAFDEAFRKSFRGQDQRHEIAGWAIAGASDDFYREGLAKVAAAESELAGLEAHRDQLQSDQDAAVSKHAEFTAPLQERLNDSSLSVAERVSIRATINAANAELESELTRLKPLLEAAESEIEFVRPRVGARQMIEMAAIQSGSPEQRERMKVLKKAHEMLENHLLFQLRKKLQTADDPITHSAVGVLTKFGKQIADEQAAIAKQRLAELYAKDN